jgi:hypothetical protein
MKVLQLPIHPIQYHPLRPQYRLVILVIMAIYYQMEKQMTPPT